MLRGIQGPFAFEVNFGSRVPPKKRDDREPFFPFNVTVHVVHEGRASVKLQ